MHLCLNMIVKNEGHIIKDTLTKLIHKVPSIDYWVISDTGSTDKTKEIITEFFKERNIPGELYEDAWKDFGHNRTLALQHAFGKSEYLFIFDADDEICSDFILPELTVDTYHLQFGDANGVKYTRPQIVNNKKKWKYEGVLHEYITCTENRDGECIITGNYYVISGKNGARSHDPNKYLKDALTLETAYKEAKQNGDNLYNRYGFYCANSYYDCGKYEDAMKWYKVTLDNNNWEQEKYVSCLKIYNCYNALNQKENGFFYLVKAFLYDKERVECLYELVSYYCANNLNDVAYNYYNIVKTFYNERYLTQGLHNKLFVDVSKGNLFLPYYMIIVCDRVKDYYTALQMYKIIFTKKYVERSKFYIGNMLFNLQFFIDNIIFKNDPDILQLFQEYIDFLISIDYPIQDHSEFMLKYEKYGIVLPKPAVSSFSPEECCKSKNILIYTGNAPFKWNDTFSLTNALGGSETAVVCLSKQFPNDYNIYVTGDVEEEKVDHVTYIHSSKLDDLIKTTPFHTIIVSRYLKFFEKYRSFSAYQTYIWGHDTVLLAYDTDLTAENILSKWSSKITGCICQTQWHKDLFLSAYPPLKDKISIINNGINTDLFTTIQVKKVENRFVYTSCSERGLYKLVQLWPRILEHLPSAELMICSYNIFPSSDEDNKIHEIINQTPSITHLGKLNRTQLYNLMSTAEYWLYPSYWCETSCITSLELLASNVICLYYPVAGLVNTLGDYGVPISEGNELDVLLNLTLGKKAELRKKGYEYALSCSWKNRAFEWGNVIFSKEKEKEITMPKWCFYYSYFPMEMITQFIRNQSHHNNDLHAIIISDNKEEILNLKPNKITIIPQLFHESILENIHDNCEWSILQTEPLNLPYRLNFILEIHKKYPQLKIYDYSKSNIKILNQHNITNCEYLSYNIHADERDKLIQFRNENKYNQIYDFGFIYDWKKLPLDKQDIITPPRRANVIEFLKKNGFKVNIVAGYGDNRDIELSKCKFVLNIHGQINENPNPSPDECSNIFEHIRCDRLLEAGYNILSETSYELDEEYIKTYNKHLKIINYNDFFDIDTIDTMVKTTTNTVKKYCFIHSCNLENVGTYRLEYLIKTMQYTGCENIFDKIYINNIGLPVENMYGEKYEVTNCSENSQLFENPTINLMNDFSKANPDSYILYLHTKGIRYSREDVKENSWINYMLYFLVEDYKNCISLLDQEYDTLGCDYSMDLDQTLFLGCSPYPPPPHYSGNFWWANSNYLKNLPKLCIKNPERNAPEFWLFKNKPNFYNLHSSNVNHYHTAYPREMYTPELEKTISCTGNTSENSAFLNSPYTLKINYLNNTCELCEIGKKYDTDKSSQRINVTDYRHCHPYTLFYDSLFKHKKNEHLKIAELGILDGGSLLMWKEYFSASEIYGFEYSDDLINNFKQKFDNERITLSKLDVTNKNSILKAFSELNELYDIIVEDTTHQFDDQIRVIENVYKYLKPGGILIIENIFKSYNEKDYINRLAPILHHFQDYFFVELDHNNKNSTGWDNDKLFILTKDGGVPIFKNTNKLTIITPSYRVNNLLEIKKSINFEYIDEWIIVYDGNKIMDNPKIFENQENNKIKEYVFQCPGISGNPQRNYALTKITNEDTLIYYLDDDNIIHPNIYKLLNIIDNDKMYTFNQYNRIKGNNLRVGRIDTAMFIMPYKLCKNIKWILDKYDADGYYIVECYNRNKDIHIFVDNDLCYYNAI